MSANEELEIIKQLYQHLDATFHDSRYQSNLKIPSCTLIHLCYQRFAFGCEILSLIEFCIVNSIKISVSNNRDLIFILITIK